MLTVEKLELRNVTVHKCFILELPPRGLILITGPNGSGKSTIVESVSMGWFGQSLRGKPPWTEDPGQILLTGFGHTVDRRRINGKNSLQFREGIQELSKYDTASKAQEALDQWIGPWELWRRSCAFSSRDSSHFTEASDADRKRLLEEVLGLEALDVASTLCRRDIRTQEDQSSALSTKLQLLEQEIDLLSAQYGQDTKDWKDLAPPSFQPVDVAALIKRKNEIVEILHREKESNSDTKYGLGKYESVLETTKAQAVKVNQLDQCPTCGQAVSKAHKGHILLTAAEIEAEVKDKLLDLVARDHKQQALIGSIQKKLDAVRGSLASAATINTQHANYLHAKEHLGARVEKLREKTDKLRTDLDQVEEEHAVLQQQLAVLGVVDKTLSTKGVRAHLLHNALAFVESTANYWLDRIAGKGLRLRLTSYVEKASGGVKEQIGMEIEGAGGGHGYKAASSGERRRIDVALILALSEITRARGGSEPGTMFFDEVFDALDTDGVAAVCDVLNDLAQSRCVVVISHSEEVVRGLRNVHQHVKMDLP